MQTECAFLIKFDLCCTVAALRLCVLCVLQVEYLRSIGFELRGFEGGPKFAEEDRPTANDKLRARYAKGHWTAAGTCAQVASGLRMQGLERKCEVEVTFVNTRHALPALAFDDLYTLGYLKQTTG